MGYYTNCKGCDFYCKERLFRLHTFNLFMSGIVAQVRKSMVAFIVIILQHGTLVDACIADKYIIHLITFNSLNSFSQFLLSETETSSKFR